MKNTTETRKIRSEIEETRRDIGEAVDDLQSRFEPDNLKAQARLKVAQMSETASKTARNLLDSSSAALETGASKGVRAIRRNPGPAVLIGLGLAWLASGRGAKQKAAIERARSAAEDARQAVDQASEQVARVNHKAKTRLAGAYARFEEMGNERPLALLAGSFAAGIGLGLLVPMTRSERAWMGDTRERVAEQAVEFAHEIKDVATNSLTAAFDKAVDEMRHSDLPQESAAEAERIAQAAVEEAQATAEEELEQRVP
ncbi:MAG: DUF3618 domain-containing protein [Candidatus Eremiobacteraeota bacterium]|nr:DUF3618 domain-containing protein [Candidatus Eremiobacteraeota bacterium]